MFRRPWAGLVRDRRILPPVTGRQSLIALALLIVLAADLLLLVFHEASRRLAALEADFAAGVLTERLDHDGEHQLAATVDYAWWDEAVAHLVGGLDPDWAAANLGAYLRRRAAVDGVAVVRPDGRLAYGDGAVADALGARALHLLARPMAPHSDGGPPRTLFYDWIGPQAVAVSAVRIDRFDSPGAATGDGSVLVLVRRLDNTYLGPIAGRLRMSGLHAVRGAAPDSLALPDPDGTSAVAMVWVADGHFPSFTDSLAPVVILVATIGLLLAAGIGLATQRMARHAASLSQRLAAIFDTIDEAVLTTDETGRVDLANPAAARLFGRPPSALSGCAVEDLLHWRDGRPATIESIIGGQRRRHVDLAAATPEGRVALLAASLSRPYADHALRYALVLRDVSESERIGASRVLLREELRATRELQGIAILARSIAHDLRNVLGLILGSAVMVLDEEADAVSRRGDAEQIIRAAERACDMIPRLLTLGLAPPPDHQPVQLDLNLLIDETAKSFGPHLPPGIRLTARSAPGALTLCVDKAALFQILLNLCLNAVEAMTGRSGCVTLETSAAVPDDVALGATRTVGILPAEPRVMFGVLDAGPGLTPDRLAGLFTPLRSTGGHALGLGLAVVARLVDRLGGALIVYTLEGFGSRFDVVLPCLPPPAPAQDDIDGVNM